MALLKKKKGDQDIQEIVTKYDVPKKSTSKKEMHSAVNDLDRARTAMSEAIQARTNLMANWRTFLTASLERWREYTTHFQQQEQACQAEINKAKEDLQQAKNDFLTKMPGDTEEISDEDIEIKDQNETATRILGGMENMWNSLQFLAAQAEKDRVEEEERINKRPRHNNAPPEAVVQVSPPADAPMPQTGGGTTPSVEVSKSPAMQPFGKPGH